MLKNINGLFLTNFLIVIALVLFCVPIASHAQSACTTQANCCENTSALPSGPIQTNNTNCCPGAACFVSCSSGYSFDSVLNACVPTGGGSCGGCTSPDIAAVYEAAGPDNYSITNCTTGGSSCSTWKIVNCAPGYTWQQVLVGSVFANRCMPATGCTPELCAQLFGPGTYTCTGTPAQCTVPGSGSGSGSGTGTGGSSCAYSTCTSVTGITSCCQYGCTADGVCNPSSGGGGGCGWANGQCFPNASFGSQCADNPSDPGTPYPVTNFSSVANGWTWTCGGAWNCASSLLTCGSANGVPSASAPTTGRCGVCGSASTAVQSGSNWTWACTAAASGFSVNCSAPVSGPAPTASLTVNGSHSVTAAVGSNLSYSWTGSGGTYSSSWTGSPSSCGSGTWTANTASGSWSNSPSSSQVGCTYTVTYTAHNSVGQVANDSITITVVSGASASCGSANNVGTNSHPTSGLCGSGNTASSVIQTGSNWTWSCSVSGSSANCSAPVTGVACYSDGNCVGANNTCVAQKCGNAGLGDGQAYCYSQYSSTSTSCDDGNSCTSGDHCNGSGSCIGSASGTHKECGGSGGSLC